MIIPNSVALMRHNRKEGLFQLPASSFLGIRRRTTFFATVGLVIRVAMDQTSRLASRNQKQDFANRTNGSWVFGQPSREIESGSMSHCRPSSAVYKGLPSQLSASAIWGTLQISVRLLTRLKECREIFE